VSFPTMMTSRWKRILVCKREVHSFGSKSPSVIRDTPVSNRPNGNLNGV
jgi:hypothetical protein